MKQETGNKLPSPKIAIQQRGNNIDLRPIGETRRQNAKPVASWGESRFSVRLESNQKRRIGQISPWPNEPLYTRPVRTVLGEEYLIAPGRWGRLLEYLPYYFIDAAATFTPKGVCIFSPSLKPVMSANTLYTLPGCINAVQLNQCFSVNFSQRNAKWADGYGDKRPDIRYSSFIVWCK